MTDTLANTVTGPMLLGALLSYFLDGVLAAQIYHYYTNYASTDRRFFVYLVGIVTCIEISYLSISTHFTYTALAVNFADPASLGFLAPSIGAVPFLNGAVGFCTHIFFAWRIRAISKNLFGTISAALIVTTALASISAATAATIQYSRMQSLGIEAVIVTMRTSVSIWLTGNAVCDVLITTTLVSILISARKLTSYSSSKGVLSMLIAHTIENGMVTSACALADQISFFVFPPNNLIHLCLNSILGRLYANVLLASLNGRERARLRLTGSGQDSAKKNGGIHTTDNFRMTGAFGSHVSQTDQAPEPLRCFPVVAVSTDVETHADDEAKNDHKMDPNELSSYGSK